MKSSFALIVLLGSLSTGGAIENPDPQQLIEAGHFKRARRIVEPQYRANPGDAELNYRMAEIEEAFGNLENARSLAEKAIKLKGHEARFHRLLGDLYGETAETASLFAKGGWARKFKAEVETAASLDPKDVSSRFDLLEYDLQAPRLMGGGKDKAAALADEIARIDPAQGELAQARLAQDRKDAAAQESWYLKAAKAQPADYEVLTVLGKFYTAASSPKAEMAEKYAREAIKAGPGRAAGYSILASTLASEARWNELEDWLALAEKNDPDDLAPYYQAARAILAASDARAGPSRPSDLSRAETYLRKYLSGEPEGGEPTAAHAHWRLGLVLEKEGRKSEARSELELAVRLKPDLAEARRDLKRLD